MDSVRKRKQRGSISPVETNKAGQLLNDITTLVALVLERDGHRVSA